MTPLIKITIALITEITDHKYYITMYEEDRTINLQ